MTLGVFREGPIRKAMIKELSKTYSPLWLPREGSASLRQEIFAYVAFWHFAADRSV